MPETISTGFSFCGRAILLESTGDPASDARKKQQFGQWMRKIRANTEAVNAERGVSKLEEIFGRFRR